MNQGAGQAPARSTYVTGNATPEVADADLLTDYSTLGRYPGHRELEQADYYQATATAEPSLNGPSKLSLPSPALTITVVMFDAAAGGAADVCAQAIGAGREW